MKKIALLLMLGTVFLLIASACQSKPAPSSGPAQADVQPTHPSAAGSNVEVQKEEAVGNDAEVVDASPEPTALALSESGAASDIPIPEEAYKLQVMRKGNSVHFQIESTIDEVVGWYQQELPKYGWELAGPPDSAIGAMATMLRENAGSDRMTINMQANELGGFINITLQVSRSSN
jgi:hypothetical protein